MALNVATLDESVPTPDDVLALDHGRRPAVTAVSTRRSAAVVRLRFYAGLTVEQAAAARRR